MSIVISIFFSTALLLALSVATSLIYTVSKALQVTQALIITLGPYFTYLFVFCLRAHFSIALPCAICCCIIVALGCELLIYMPMRKKKAPAFAYLVVSIAIYTILQNCISLVFGDDAKILDQSVIRAGHLFFGAYISNIQILTISICPILFLCIYLMLAHTLLGKRIRAVAENAELANIYGISVNKTILVCICISSTIGAIVGVFSALDTTLSPGMGFNLLLYGVVVMIIAGIGSFKRLLLASFFLASLQNLTAFFLAPQWMDAVTYTVLICFLIFKPLGFSGKLIRKKEI